MDTPTTQLPAVSQSKRRRSGCVLLFCLFFLVIGALPTLGNLPGWLARFTGMETTAHVTAAGSCSWEEANTTGGEMVINGYHYVYTYTVSSGKIYQITDLGCSNADTPGTSETIWYQPADPTHFITANNWTFDWIFFLGFSIPMLLFAFSFFRQVFRRLSAPSRRFTGMSRE